MHATEQGAVLARETEEMARRIVIVGEGDNTFVRDKAWEIWRDTVPEPDTAVIPETPPTNPKRIHGIRKPSPQYIPPIAIIEEAVVMALGAEKYGAFNWQSSKVDATTYYSAAMRHLMSWFAGEDVDRESGASHLAHVRACMGILIDAAATGQLVDDRPRCGSVSDGVDRLTVK